MKEKPLTDDVPLYRLYVLRAYYAFMAFGSFAVFWPSLLTHTHEWGLDNGAQYSLLSALAPLALLGLRYPLKMLPLVLYEFLWKALWFAFVMAPLWTGGRMTENEWANAFAIGLAIVLTPIVTPWRYVWRNFVSARGDRWWPRAT